MKDALTYRVSAEGELEFSKACAQAKKWIGANISGPLKLVASISLKAVAVGEGESVQTVSETGGLFPNGHDAETGEKPKRGRRKKDVDEAAAAAD